ncbi:MAG: cytochrome c biogenesis protein ResB [Bacteroidales bacterium]
MKTVKKIADFIFSMAFMGIVVAILAVSMAVATFVESRAGTMAAQALIYQAWWFELAILLAFVNILASIIRLKLYNLKKIPVFIFHVSFLVIILGAAITRYIGEEGSMRIREGQTTADYLSSDTYFYIKAENSHGTEEHYQKVYLSAMSKRQVNLRFSVGADKVRVKSAEYLTGSRVQMNAMGMGGQGGHPDVLKVIVTLNGGSDEIMIRGRQGQGFITNEFELGGTRFTAAFGSKPMVLPFSLKLEEFQLERYPGSNSPSSFASEVVLIDPAAGVNRPHRIFMNNILTYRGYRFYQSSYDQDEQGTVLSVNHDGLGTTVTYIGYGLMILFIILALFAPGSRFRRLLKESRRGAVVAGMLLVMLTIGGLQNRAVAQSLPQAPPKAEAREFGKLWVQGSEGRMKPVNTLAQEMIRKMFGRNNIQGMTPDQFWLSLMAEADRWHSVRLFEVKNAELAAMFKVQGKKASFNDFVTEDSYLLSELVNEAYNKRPNQRNGFDKAVIKLDEQLNVFFMGMNGSLLKIYPDPRDPKAKWLDRNELPSGLVEDDSLLIRTSVPGYIEALYNASAAEAGQWRTAIDKFQKRYGSSVLPQENKSRLEVLYNRTLVFERLTLLYGLIGLIFLAIQLFGLFRSASWIKPVSRVMALLVGLGFLLHTLGLALRWYLSGHAPMSNGYESMIFVAWGTILAGLLVMRRSMLTLSLTAVLAALSLLVAHMSWMNPEITPLVPVLKSVWLTIHVAVIMTSYSFLGLGALIGLVSMVLFVTKTRKNHERIDGHIRHLTRLNQIVLIALLRRYLPNHFSRVPAHNLDDGSLKFLIDLDQQM